MYVCKYLCMIISWQSILCGMCINLLSCSCIRYDVQCYVWYVTSPVVLNVMLEFIVHNNYKMFYKLKCYYISTLKNIMWYDTNYVCNKDHNGRHVNVWIQYWYTYVIIKIRTKCVQSYSNCSTGISNRTHTKTSVLFSSSFIKL